MEGYMTIRTKEGIAFKGNIWELIFLLLFKKEYVLMDEVVYIDIDGQVIPRPESMEDDS